MHKLVRSVDFVLAAVCVAIFVTMTCCTVWQVFSRFVLESASTVTDEMARLLFMSLAMFGGAYTAGQKRHLSIELLPQSLKGGARRRLAVFINLVAMAFACIILIYGGGRLALNALAAGQTSPVLGFPMGCLYFSIPIGGVLFAFYTLVNIAESICNVSFRENRGAAAPGDG